MIHLKSLLREWTGAGWKSCTQWSSHKQKFFAGSKDVKGAKITVTKTTTAFKLKYIGPASGISIAHANGDSGDTLHQLFNVLICEINPWLAGRTLKPQIEDIITSCDGKKGGTYTFIMYIPLIASKSSWQLNHRGSWSGSDPGGAAVMANSPAGAEGPARNVTSIPGYSDITTYFATYKNK